MRLLFVGDVHATMGDGEVSGTAIESPLERAQVTWSPIANVVV